MTKATIISATKLTEEQIKKIVSLYPFIKDMEIEETIDTALMAGFVIVAGSRRVDMSLSAQLQKLQQSMYESI